MKKVLIAYIPVLHEGYRRLFVSHKDATLYILGTDLISEFTYLSKEIRQLDPELVKKSVQSWKIFPRVEILNKKKLESLSKEKVKVVMPNEDIMLELGEKYFKDK